MNIRYGLSDLGGGDLVAVETPSGVDYSYVDDPAEPDAVPNELARRRVSEDRQSWFENPYDLYEDGDIEEDFWENGDGKDADDPKKIAEKIQKGLNRALEKRHRGVQIILDEAAKKAEKEFLAAGLDFNDWETGRRFSILKGKIRRAAESVTENSKKRINEMTSFDKLENICADVISKYMGTIKEPCESQETAGYKNVNHEETTLFSFEDLDEEEYAAEIWET